MLCYCTLLQFTGQIAAPTTKETSFFLHYSAEFFQVNADSSFLEVTLTVLVTYRVEPGALESIKHLPVCCSYCHTTLDVFTSDPWKLHHFTWGLI